MRLNIDRQKELEPKRMSYAKSKIESLGYEIKYQDETTIIFDFNGCEIKFFPYSGWHTGRTITDGRGLSKLIRQIKK